MYQYYLILNSLHMNVFVLPRHVTCHSSRTADECAASGHFCQTTQQLVLQKAERTVERSPQGFQ